MTDSGKKAKSNPPPSDINMRDLINSIFLNPLDAIHRSIAGSDPLAPLPLDPISDSKADPSKPSDRHQDQNEQLRRQIRPPTDDELAQIRDIAGQAATIQDEIQATLGDKPRRLKALKDELLDKMLNHGMRSVSIPGRAPIEVVSRNEKTKTMKAIIAAAGSKGEGMRIWKALPTDTKSSLSIPGAAPPDEEPPY